MRTYINIYGAAGTLCGCGYAVWPRVRSGAAGMRWGHRYSVGPPIVVRICILYTYMCRSIYPSITYMHIYIPGIYILPVLYILYLFVHLFEIAFSNYPHDSLCSYIPLVCRGWAIGRRQYYL